MAVVKIFEAMYENPLIEKFVGGFFTFVEKCHMIEEFGFIKT